MNDEQLLADWLKQYGATLQPFRGLLRVRRAEPGFAFHNYFSRFKVEIATFDGTGENPTDVTCVVVETSVTNNSARIVPGLKCEDIGDL